MAMRYDFGHDLEDNLMVWIRKGPNPCGVFKARMLFIWLTNFSYEYRLKQWRWGGAAKGLGWFPRGSLWHRFSGEREFSDISYELIYVTSDCL